MLFSFCLLGLAAAESHRRQVTSVPDYVTKYAPLVYLDQNEIYFPADIQAQLNNTNPTLNFTAITTGPSPLLLSDLADIDTSGCSIDDFDDCPVYLTSKDDISKNPPWLFGTLPDESTFETVGAKSSAIIVNDHLDGNVDVIYMYFYAFDLGPPVLGNNTGNHVGDWEHSMVRFNDGLPVSVWLSQHDYGQAFAYETLSKNGSRPIIYSALGTHANYAVPGTHSRSIATVIVNDSTSSGSLWDPAASALFYNFTQSTTDLNNGTFTPYDVSTPTSWLHYLGRWGDEQYPDSDPRQVNLLNLNITWLYMSGPTGPLDKQLNRSDVCPKKSGTICSTLTVLPVSSGSSIPVTITRTQTTQSPSSTPTLTSTGAATSPTTTGTSSVGRIQLGLCNTVLLSAAVLFYVLL